jgi:hypothetical protein
VLSKPLSDVHLNIVPRTAEEQTRIGAPFAPQTVFSVQQRFEKNSAGAAAVRAGSKADTFS